MHAELQPKPETQQEVPAAQQPEPQKPLTLPEKPEDLAGCWQSDRGDIEIVTDDERRAHEGNVSILDNNLDRRTSRNSDPHAAPILHPNIRGPRYYH